ncbi:MAG: ABC transporter ATP-binding protein [Gracilibacter sp. BRH_c7a]|nr:MAG: ABC transporter ATP-binding protein [Gracilibacter sp. BRH_c7a]
MTNDNVLLAIDKLNVHYRQFQALYDVSVKIKKGSIVSIIGSNGAGKSTLLNTILGINRPTSGSVTFMDQRIDGLPTNRIAAKGLSMSPEGSRVFPNLTVKENLLMGAYIPQARKNKEAMLEKAYDLFPVLKEKSKQEANYLSGGQRQMLAIARAIMAGPKILFCDEISLGLAPVVIKDIYKKIQEINDEGITIVLIEQDVKRSLKYSDYSYVILKGNIVMEGKSSELPVEEVTDAYFGENKYAIY